MPRYCRLPSLQLVSQWCFLPVHQAGLRCLFMSRRRCAAGWCSASRLERERLQPCSLEHMMGKNVPSRCCTLSMPTTRITRKQKCCCVRASFRSRRLMGECFVLSRHLLDDAAACLWRQVAVATAQLSEMDAWRAAGISCDAWRCARYQQASPGCQRTSTRARHGL